MKNKSCPVYFAGASPIERTILGVALKKCKIRTVFPNNQEARYIRLALDQPTGFRSKMVEQPLRGQQVMSMVNLAQMILPKHFEAKNIRVCIHKVFAVKLNHDTSLAFYKEYFFQIFDSESRSNILGVW